MKCFIAFAILGIVGVPLVGGALYALFAVPHLAGVLAFLLLVVGAIFALIWAVVTAGQCMGYWP